MHFVDLFAGLGGFHLALRHLGHECVLASESDVTLRSFSFFGAIPGARRRYCAAACTINVPFMASCPELSHT